MPVVVDRGEGADDEWEAEEILDLFIIRGKKGILKYVVKWLGFYDPTKEV